MLAGILRRLTAPEFLVRPELVCGPLPATKEAYSTAFGTAWASIAETFLIALISIADTVMVGVIGPHAIAAVGLVTQPRFIVLSLILSLNVAVTSICARRKGENDPEGATDCLKQALILSLVISVAVSAIALCFSRELLTFAGAQPDTIGPAMDYFNVLLKGTPANALLLTISAAQRGIGQTRVSMIINMASNATNLVFNYLLIGGNLGFPRMETRGAAIATVIGFSVGLLLAVLSIAHRRSFLYVFTREGWRFDSRTLRSVWRVASGSFGEQICMRIGFFSYSIICARLGTVLFAAHHIFMNILSLSFSLGEGFGIAATSLVGQNLGAKRPDLSIIYGKVCQRMSLATCVLMFFVFIFGGRGLTQLFTGDERILALTGSIMWVMGAVVIAQSSQMIMLGCLRGAGDTFYTAVVSLICIVLLRPAASWALAYPAGLGLLGVWLGLVADQYMRLWLTMRRFSSGKWMTIKV